MVPNENVYGSFVYKVFFFLHIFLFIGLEVVCCIGSVNSEKQQGMFS